MPALAHEQIDAAPLPGGPIDHRLNLIEIGNVGAVSHRDAAGFSNLLDHGLSRRQRTAGAVPPAAEIVDHELGAAGR